MSFVAAAKAERLARRNAHGPRLDGEHVRAERHTVRAGAGDVADGAEAGVEVCFAVFRHYAGVKLRLISRALAKARAVRVMDVAVKFILSSGTIADSDGDNAHFIKDVIEIIPSVRARASHRERKGTCCRPDWLGPVFSCK